MNSIWPAGQSNGVQIDSGFIWSESRWRSLPKTGMAGRHVSAPARVLSDARSRQSPVSMFVYTQSRKNRPRTNSRGIHGLRNYCRSRWQGAQRVYFDKNGVEHEVFARAIVVPGNAVETARLLLLSKSRLFPDGLANSSGLVGKRFMEHLSVFACGVFPERLDPWRGVPTGGIIQDFYATNAVNTFARGWTTSVENEGQWPLATASRVEGWGEEHKERMKQILGHMVGVASDGEQLPDESNQVTLDSTVQDYYSLPVPHIENGWGKNDTAMIAAMSKSHAEILEAAGATEVSVYPCVAGGSSHYLGTCRMGTNSATSVVDPWCRTHDVPNLFIGDGSVFVTGAAVNPALTISALAARTADNLVKAFKRSDL